jgi:pyocin large subunit-like protein
LANIKKPIESCKKQQLEIMDTEKLEAIMDTEDITTKRVWKTEKQELNGKNKNTTRYVMRMLGGAMDMILACGLPIKLRYSYDFEREDSDRYF